MGRQWKKRVQLFLIVLIFLPFKSVCSSIAICKGIHKKTACLYINYGKGHPSLLSLVLPLLPGKSLCKLIGRFSSAKCEGKHKKTSLLSIDYGKGHQSLLSLVLPLLPGRSRHVWDLPLHQPAHLDSGTGLYRLFTMVYLTGKTSIAMQGLKDKYCAADFSLLNLPKGKSLGRSKPATNS